MSTFVHSANERIEVDAVIFSSWRKTAPSLVDVTLQILSSHFGRIQEDDVMESERALIKETTCGGLQLKSNTAVDRLPVIANNETEFGTQCASTMRS